MLTFTLAILTRCTASSAITPAQPLKIKIPHKRDAHRLINDGLWAPIEQALQRKTRRRA